LKVLGGVFEALLSGQANVGLSVSGLQLGQSLWAQYGEQDANPLES
jgi:hypothetical protein